MTAHARAAIVTIGDEIVTGDVQNTNGSWLAKRLEALGIGVTLQLAVRDDLAQIADFGPWRRETYGAEILALLARATPSPGSA